jgi:hypothetical protein
VKGTTKALLCLSAALVAVLGTLAFVALKSDAWLKDAGEKIDAGIEANRILAESNEGMAKAKQAERAELAQMKKTLAARDITIAKLRAAADKGTEIAGAAVEAGADLWEAFAAGKAIVEAVAVPALTEWYAATGGRIPPLLEYLGLIQFQLAIIGPRVPELEASTADLSASVLRLDSLFVTDEGLIAQQRGTIAGQAINLQGARDDVVAAVNARQLAEVVAWSAGGVAIAELVYIVAHALGWLK